MGSVFHPVLLADLFDRFRIQLAEEKVNALTAIWTLLVGAVAGIALTAALWGFFWMLSSIPGIGDLSKNPPRRRIVIGVLAAVFFGWLLAVWLALGGGQAVQLADRIWAVLGCAIAGGLLAIGVVTLSSRKALAETSIALREGVLWPLWIIALVMAGCAVFGLFIVRRPTELLTSLARWPAIAVAPEAVYAKTLPAPANAFDDPEEVVIDVNLRRDEVRSLIVTSDQHVRVRSEPFSATSDPALMVAIDVPAGETKTWRRAEASGNPFRQPLVTRFYAKNLGNAPATLRLTAEQQVAHPEMLVVPIMAVGMAAIFFIYMLQRAAVPKLAAVALSTAKSDMAQPLYAIVLVLGVFLLIVFLFIPYNTFGDDIKQLKDSGLSLILVLCIFQAVWSASTSVAEELEGKTALTVLSKPVSRRDFVLGKFAGIGWSVGLMAVIFGLILLATVAYKPVYDYREGGYEINYQPQNTDPTWHDCHREMIQTVPGIVLAFLETLVIAALSVAISTRLPAIANFLICSAVYVLGHLTPLLVQSQVVAEQLPPVVFFGRLIATVLPVLDHFNIQASVAAGVPVPPVYLAWSLVYCVLYSAVAMLLALTLFEDRDLA